MLNELHKTKNFLEGSIAGFLNEAAKIQTEAFEESASSIGMMCFPMANSIRLKSRAQ